MVSSSDCITKSRSDSQHKWKPLNSAQVPPMMNQHSYRLRQNISTSVSRQEERDSLLHVADCVAIGRSSSLLVYQGGYLCMLPSHSFGKV